MSEKMEFILDVVGSCNLRCPSCPVGNFPEVKTSSGLMSPELLDKIMRKAVSECELEWVALYNWTEPLLHPKLPELIRTVRSHGDPCLLSSNLYVLRNIDEVLKAGPRELRISVSGFEQERYGVTHRHGQIERVKENMSELAAARQRTRSKTNIHVAFHRYVDNHDDERQMRAYAESLGFEFKPMWAYFMPLEKNLAYLGDNSTKATITDADRQLIDRLALLPDEASRAVQPYRPRPCVLRDRQMVLDFEGNVMLCCAVYDRESYTLGAYLDVPLEELQKSKYRHKLCGKCISKGLHVVGMYGAEELNDIALARVKLLTPDAVVDPLPVGEGKNRHGLRRLVHNAKNTVRNSLRRAMATMGQWN